MYVYISQEIYSRCIGHLFTAQLLWTWISQEGDSAICPWQTKPCLTRLELRGINGLLTKLSSVRVHDVYSPSSIPNLVSHGQPHDVNPFWNVSQTRKHMVPYPVSPSYCESQYNYKLIQKRHKCLQEHIIGSSKILTYFVDMSSNCLLQFITSNTICYKQLKFFYWILLDQVHHGWHVRNCDSQLHASHDVPGWTAAVHVASSRPPPALVQVQHLSSGIHSKSASMGESLHNSGHCCTSTIDVQW